MKGISRTLLFALLLLAAGCSPKKVAAPLPTTQTGSARVSGIEILRLATEPVQVRVLIQGELLDGCTTIQKIAGGKTGEEFQYTITVSRPSEAACPPAPVAFERLIALDVNGLPAGRYTVSVDGVQEAFELALPISPAAQIAASLEATPVAPTATAEGQPPAPAGSPTPAAGSLEGTQPPAPVAVEPAATVTPTVDAEPVQVSNCTDRAAFYGDVTIPDDTTMRQGEDFTKTWRIHNEGTCPWGPGYSLVFAGGEVMSGPLSASLPDVQPGSNADISVVLTAPSRGGTHTGQWQFQNAAGQRFGVGTSGQDAIWVQVLVNFVASDSTADTGTASGCDTQTNPDIEEQVLALMNEARLAAGLSKLVMQEPLTAAARQHSVDMACQGFTDHTGSDGSTWFTRIAGQGYAYSNALENIFYGFLTYGGGAEGAFKWWKGSQTHWDNILDPNVSEVGIGYAHSTHSTYDSYYTVDFAAPGEE